MCDINLGISAQCMRMETTASCSVCYMFVSEQINQLFMLIHILYISTFYMIKRKDNSSKLIIESLPELPYNSLYRIETNGLCCLSAAHFRS